MIPKKHIVDTNCLTKDDLEMLEKMKSISEKLLNDWNPDEPYRLYFHKARITAIKHLHLHLLVEPMNFKGKLFFNWLTLNRLEDII
jgi:diadenosine tetraphosphate (Ap4A) HIT family hydrolase